MPDADASPLRPEPNTNSQTSECPTAERPVPEKTESTAQEEAKTQDAADGKASHSSEDSTEDEEHIEFDEWVKSFAADPDSAWEQMQVKFEALMATDSDGYMAQDIQEDEEDTGKLSPVRLDPLQTDHALQRLQMRLPRLQESPNASHQTPKKTSRNTKKTASAVNASRQVCQKTTQKISLSTQKNFVKATRETADLGLRPAKTHAAGIIALFVKLRLQLEKHKLVAAHTILSLMGTTHNRFQPSSKGQILRKEDWSPKTSYTDTKYFYFCKKAGGRKETSD